MGLGGGIGAGQRLLAAVRALPRVLREDLWSAAADPLPRMAWPRWLAWLPHVLVVAYAVLAFDLHTRGNDYGPNRLGMLIAGVQAAALVVAMFRPVPAWWLATAATVVGAVTVSESVPGSITGLATQAGVLFLLALRMRPRVVAEALVISAFAGLAGTGFDLGLAPGVLWIHTEVARSVAVFALAAAFGAVLRGGRVCKPPPDPSAKPSSTSPRTGWAGHPGLSPWWAELTPPGRSTASNS